MPWKPINTAPKDGREITVRRTFEGRTVYEGPAVWRTVNFPSIPPDALGRDCSHPAYKATGWMKPQRLAEKRVPEPTEWMLEE